MEVYGKIDISNAIITSHGFFAGQTTTTFQNVFGPQDNGSLTGFFFDCWNPTALANTNYSPNMFDVTVGWLCNGPGVTNAPVTFVGNQTNAIITIAAGHGGFQSGQFYFFTGV